MNDPVFDRLLAAMENALRNDGSAQLPMVSPAVAQQFGGDTRIGQLVTDLTAAIDRLIPDDPTSGTYGMGVFHASP